VAQKHKLTVVKDFIGHGVGTVFHADPQVFHHKTGQRLGTMQVRLLQEIPITLASLVDSKCVGIVAMHRRPVLWLATVLAWWRTDTVAAKQTVV
jgi:hypothetical protein